MIVRGACGHLLDCGVVSIDQTVWCAPCREWRSVVPVAAVDEQAGISIRLIRQWRPETSSEAVVAFWADLRRLVAAREQLRAQAAYEVNLTPEGRAVLEQLGIAPG